MKIKMRLLAKLGLLSFLSLLSAGPVCAQADLGKTILEKLTAKVAKLESACANDIKKYCRTVTPGEGRMIYCMQAHEDKISPKCAFELGDTAASVQITADALKDGVIACKAEIAGVCGKIVPGQGRIATCLLENKSTVSSGCAEAIKKDQSVRRLTPTRMLVQRGWRWRNKRLTPRGMRIPATIQRKYGRGTIAPISKGWGRSNPAFSQMFTNVFMPENATPEHQQWFNDLQRLSASAANASRLLRSLDDINVVDYLPAIKAPTLVLHCRDDSAVPFEQGRLIASRIPHARFVSLESRNHVLLPRDPAWPVFVSEVRKFLCEGAPMKSATAKGVVRGR
jgi:hypothetical protein